MGTGDLRSRSGISCLLRNFGAEHRQGSGGAARGDSAFAAETAAAAYESLQRNHPGAHEADGVVRKAGTEGTGEQEQGISISRGSDEGR